MQRSAKIGILSPSFTEPYTLICSYTVQIVLSVLTALIAVIIAYGAIGQPSIGILGPVFIPWMVFDKTDFLFWGWLKAFVGFEFYKVVAAATMSVMSHLLITYLTSGAMNIDSPRNLIYVDARAADALFRCWFRFVQNPDDDCNSLLRPRRRA